MAPAQAPRALSEEDEELLSRRLTVNELFAAAHRALPPLPSSITETSTSIETPSGYSSPALVFAPLSPLAAPPLVILFFGGGYALGNPSQVARPARDWAAAYDAVVVCPSYRLVPDVRFPVPQRDAYEVVKWCAENAKEKWGCDLNKGFIVGGVSAGAGIAMGVLGIDNYGVPAAEPERWWTGIEKLPCPVTGFFLGIPAALTSATVPMKYAVEWTSRKDNREGNEWFVAEMEQIPERLQVDEDGERSAWLSAVNLAGRGKVRKQLPRVYVLANGKDILRDDGLILEKTLQDEGFETRLGFGKEDGHVMWLTMHGELKSKEPSQEEMIMDGMKWLLRP